MRDLLTRWLEALGAHIARHGWIDPTGAATPPPLTVSADADPDRVERRAPRLVD